MDTDVLIVGAGPVGLFLAIECVRRGLRWRLVEAKPTQSSHSKGARHLSSHARNFDMAALVAPFMEVANRVTSVAGGGASLPVVEEAEDEAPSLDFVRQILRQRALAAIEARALRWSSYFHVHHRQVAPSRRVL